MTTDTNTNTPDFDIEAVLLRRVKKLLAIAEDGRADPNEAAAAARMAESVMRKFQIERADVIATELRAGAATSFAEADVGATMNPAARNGQEAQAGGVKIITKVLA